MSPKTTREKIFSAVTTPLSLLTLMVLVAEGLLFLLTEKAEGTDFTIIVVGMVLVIPLVLLVLYLRPSLFKQNTLPERMVRPIYDVFISTPMAAYDDDEKYQRQRLEILRIRDALKDHCKIKKVFYAGVDIAKKNDFEASDISAKDDFEAINSSKLLIFVYPEKLASGALVEVGAAIALRVPCLFLVPDRETLPFMLKQADQAFDYIKVYTVKNTEEILNLIKHHGSTIFPKNKT